jgi:hypothetical protein
MRGAVHQNAPSYLPTLLDSGSHGVSLLAALHGNGGQTRDTADPIEALARAKSGETSEVALVAAKPQVKRDIAQFAQALATAETPAQLLANPRGRCCRTRRRPVLRPIRRPIRGG